MPLTNAEKQKRHRQKRMGMLARYEAALREIAGDEAEPRNQAAVVARNALNPVTAGEDE